HGKQEERGERARESGGRTERNKAGQEWEESRRHDHRRFLARRGAFVLVNLRREGLRRGIRRRTVRTSTHRGVRDHPGSAVAPAIVRGKFGGKRSSADLSGCR
ncbi:unnamed protein product, partial [Ectocarpus sp. 12 AP-2014]